MTADGARTDAVSALPTGLAHPRYRADIDGLRAVAVLSVVAFHATPEWVSGGFVGVDVFFVISGFLISTILYGSLERGTFSFAEFYSRRIRRIFPALLAVLAACIATGWLYLLADEYKQLGKHIAAGAGFVSNFALWKESGYFDTAADAKPLLHLWSLGIEEQFYILWPLVLWSAWKSRLNVLTVTLSIAGLSFAMNLASYQGYRAAAFYLPQARFWELLAGAVLAYVTLHPGRLWPYGRDRLNIRKFGCPGGMSEYKSAVACNVRSASGMLLIAAGVFEITKDTPFPGPWALLPVVGAMLVISAGAHAWINRAILSNRVAVWFGVISYPLYLWHWPLLSFARIFAEGQPGYTARLVLVLTAILLAWATTTFIERPLRYGAKSHKAGWLFALMVLIGVTGYGTLEHDGLPGRSVAMNNYEADASVKLTAYRAAGCTIPNVSKYVVCAEYKPSLSRGTIVLWGDSTVRMWLPVFLDIAHEHDYTIVQVDHLACPPILGVRKTTLDAVIRSYCDPETMRNIFEFIKSAKPDLIVVLAAWNSYSPYSHRELVTDGNEAEADPATTERAIRSKVPFTLNRLSEVGRVIVFKSWPFLPAEPVYNINRTRFLEHDRDYVTAPLNDFVKDSALINSIFDAVGDRVELFDPARKICAASGCSSVHGTTAVYRDRYHVTVHGAMLFRPEIENIILAREPFGQSTHKR